MNEIEGRDYAQDDHDLLMDAAATVLLATVAAERSGPVAYFSEMTAAGTFLYEARERYADNRLVQELFRRQEDREVAEEQGRVTQETLLRDIDRIDSVLRRDREGLEFRRFLLELAEKVAKASRSGWFGPRISASEEAFLGELRQRFGLQDE